MQRKKKQPQPEWSGREFIPAVKHVATASFWRAYDK
jgi:hypothetical protein